LKNSVISRKGEGALLGDGPPAEKQDIADQLAKLAKLREAGTITQEEFERLKTKLI
jgi:hypothetical protein